jgi:hypothetical protein
MTVAHRTDQIANARREIDRLRTQLDTLERLADARDASLQEIAKHAEDLRCQTADLTDDAHTQFADKPYPPGGLRYVTERVSRLADTMARAADGYAGARADDMHYPDVLSDLAEHGWKPRPDRALDGTLPPIPITELADRRGYRRGFARGAGRLTLWFTSPQTLAYARSDRLGYVNTVADVRTAITRKPAAES